MLAVGMLFCLFFVLLICLTLVITFVFVYTRGGACCGAAGGAEREAGEVTILSGMSNGTHFHLHRTQGP